MTAMARPNPQAQEADRGSTEDDPLVELARIVSGRSTSEEPRRRNVFNDEPALSEADLARDLEMELLSDLQASFSAAGEGENDQPPFYAEEDLNEADAAYDQEPPADTSVDDPNYYAEEAPAEAGAYDDALDAAYDAEEDVPPLPDAGTAPQGLDTTFADVGLRGSRGGPAYNPNALLPPEDEAALGRDDLAPPAPATGWAATADDDAFQAAHDAAAEQVGWDVDPAGPEAAEPEQAFDPAYQGTMAAANAFGVEAAAPAPAAAVAPAPAAPRHRDRRLDADPEGIGARRAVRRRTSGRYYTVFGVLALVAIGTAAVLVLRGGGDTEADIPLIAAAEGETMVFPEEPPVDDAGNVVFQRTDPDEVAPAEDTILPGVEPMADINAATETEDGIGDILAPATEPDDTAPAADMPRMVRTTTVLADGTIVANGTVPADGDAAAPAEDTTPPENAAAPVEDTTPEATPPAEPAAETPPAEPAVETPAPADVAALTPPPTPTAADPIAPGLYVQVAALGTEALAQDTLQDFRARAPAILQNQPAVIQRAELAAGVYFRVWFGPLSSGEAESLRQQLTAAGIDSFIQAQN